MRSPTILMFCFRLKNVETTMDRRSSFLLIVPAVLLLNSGCESGPHMYPVSGQVIYKGEPVAEGDIFFEDAALKQDTAFGKIKDGKYELIALPGEKKVRIRASKETGKVIEGAMGAKIAQRVDLIPRNYNTETTLTRSVEAKSGQILDFKLE